MIFMTISLFVCAGLHIITLFHINVYGINTYSGDLPPQKLIESVNVIYPKEYNWCDINIFSF